MFIQRLIKISHIIVCIFNEILFFKLLLLSFPFDLILLHEDKEGNRVSNTSITSICILQSILSMTFGISLIIIFVS
jgi:hypothetical protein